MHPDRIAEGVGVPVPYVVNEFLLGDQAPLVKEEILQNRKLFCCQPNWCSVKSSGPVQGVQGQFSIRQAAGLLDKLAVQ